MRRPAVPEAKHIGLMAVLFGGDDYGAFSPPRPEGTAEGPQAHRRRDRRPRCQRAGRRLTPAVPQEPPQRARLIEAACDLPTRLLVRTLHGHREDRSGDIDIVPQEPDFVGHGGLPHSGPWDYVEQVPLLWYGPGYIEPRGSVSRVVTLADIAPTQGALVEYPFDAPDGSVLHEALAPSTNARANHRGWSSWWCGMARVGTS